MLKVFKDFDKNYSTLFFCIALLIIIVCLVYSNVMNVNKEKKCAVPNTIVNNYNNYAYDIVIEKNGVITKLYVKRYNTKYLIEMNENDTKSTYYINHTDLLEKASNGKYIKFRKDNIVDGLDNKFLIFDYINELSLKSSVSTKNGVTCYNNRNLELSMCINLDNSITLEMKDYKITYTIKENGMISDFDVEIDSSSYNVESSSEIIENSTLQQ